MYRTWGYVTKETTELRFWTWGNDHVPHFLIVTDL